MRHIHAIINPAAGGGRARRRWPNIARQILDSGVILDEHFTTRRGEAAEIARWAILHNAAEILIVGGDGVINEVVNAFLNGAVAQRRDCTLSFIPVGSGCDFARNIGVRSMHDAMHALLADRIEAVDVGQVVGVVDANQSRFFINSADIGLGARVAQRVNRSRKRLGGTIAYFASALREIPTARPFNIRASIDDQLVHDGPALMALIINGRCYGGGMVASPTASVTDGLLDLIILKQTSRVNLMCSLLPRVYRGTHVGHPAVIAARGKRIEVECDQPMPIALDGEAATVQMASVSVLPSAVRVRVPPGCEILNPLSQR